MDNDQMKEAVAVVGESIGNLFSSIAPHERPLWLANFFEALSFWSGSADGSEVAGLVDCLARYEGTFVLKPPSERKMVMTSRHVPERVNF